jgi:hypothetical protein
MQTLSGRLTLINPAKSCILERRRPFGCQAFPIVFKVILSGAAPQRSRVSAPKEQFAPVIVGSILRRREKRT